jgi:endoglucanase
MSGINRGINFGNALDALDGDGPPLRLEERYFDEVKAAGFDTVRLPVAWSAHAEDSAPYTIGEQFLERVDQAVANALGRDLNIVLNVHHYHGLNLVPDGHADRFVALWRQIAAHFAGHPPRLHFELLNEPRAAMTAQRWNALLPLALTAVRESNPDRVVLIGSAEMNGIDALRTLALPADDHLMATVHYYAPLGFTHQGAHWVEGSASWLGTTWGSDADNTAVEDDLNAAATWAEDHSVALFLGEFGSYEKADMPSRVRWTAQVRKEAERLGIGWAYWDFGTDFGVYEPETGSWREPLRRALFPS